MVLLYPASCVDVALMNRNIPCAGRVTAPGTPGTTTSRKLEPDSGLEPLTYRLQGDCSAIELIRHFGLPLRLSRPGRWSFCSQPITLRLYAYPASFQRPLSFFVRDCPRPLTSAGSDPATGGNARTRTGSQPLMRRMRLPIAPRSHMPRHHCELHPIRGFTGSGAGRSVPAFYSRPYCNKIGDARNPILSRVARLQGK